MTEKNNNKKLFIILLLVAILIATVAGIVAGLYFLLRNNTTTAPPITTAPTTRPPITTAPTTRPPTTTPPTTTPPLNDLVLPGFSYVEFFSETNYTGTSFKLPVGLWKFQNNTTKQIKSFKIIETDNQNYGGPLVVVLSTQTSDPSELPGSEQYRIFSDDQPYLTRQDSGVPKWFPSNNFRLIYILPNTFGNGVELCEFCRDYVNNDNKAVVCRNYSIGTYSFILDDRYNRPDAISSIKIDGDYELRLFDDGFLQGEMKVYRSNVDCMDGNWGDRANSAIIYPGTDIFSNMPVDAQTISCNQQGCTYVF